MSDENPRPAVRIWNAIVLVVRGLLRAIETALLFGPWGFGVGRLLGFLVGGLIALAGNGAALIFGPLVGAGIGAALGAARSRYLVGRRSQGDRFAIHALKLAVPVVITNFERPSGAS